MNDEQLLQSLILPLTLKPIERPLFLRSFICESGNLDIGEEYPGSCVYLCNQTWIFCLYKTQDPFRGFPSGVL